MQSKKQQKQPPNLQDPLVNLVRKLDNNPKVRNALLKAAWEASKIPE